MVFTLATFQGVRYSLFHYSTSEGAAEGYADFDTLTVAEDAPRAIPYDKRIELSAGRVPLRLENASVFQVVNRRLGRVALKTGSGFVSVNNDGEATVRGGAPGQSETFQWMETFDGDVLLMSLVTNRFLRLDAPSGRASADSPGPRPAGDDGVRFQWKKR